MELNKYIKYMFHVLVTIWLLLYFLSVSSCISTEKTDGKKYNILIIQSFRKDCFWGQDLEQGIIDCFKSYNILAQFQIIYTDCEFLKEDQQKKLIVDYLDEYPDPDLIFVCDDQATRALMTSEHPLTYRIPIIFSGVDYFDPDLLNSRKNVTGYTTKPDYLKAIALIKSLYPELKGLAVDIDDSELCHTAIKEFREQLKSFYEPIDIQVNNMDVRPGKEYIWNATFVNNYPRIMPVWSSFYARRASNMEVPFFAVNSEGMGQGYLGGYMTLPYDQTYMAAETGVKLLRGESVSGFPIRQSEQQLILDWKQAKKYNINLSDLPDNAVFINRSFLEKYGRTIFWSIIIILILIIVVFSLLAFLYKIEKKERTFTQIELQGHRNRLKIVMSSIREGVISFDKELNIFAINPAALKWLQLPGNEKQYIGRSVLSVIELTDIPKHETLKSIVSSVFTTNKSISFESSHMISLMNDSIFPVKGSVSLILQEDKVYGAVIVFSDVSEELARREYLGLTLGAGDIFSWRLDFVQNSIFFDPTFFTRFGIEQNADGSIPIDEIVKTIHPEDLEKCREINRQLLEGEVDRLIFEMRFNINGKGYQWWELRYTCLDGGNNDGLPVIFGLSRNVEEFKQTLKSIEQARDKATLSDKLKSAFLANMSHEIRTPLNAIVGFSNVLTSGEDFEPEERKIFIETIRNNCELLLALISDVLDIAQIESGTMLFKEEICDLNELFGQIIITQRVIIPEHLALIGQIPPTSTYIITDKLRLNQVITNLINNAVKFTSEGKVTIGYTTENDKYIHIFVEDTGKGITEDDQKSIFERFFKKDDFKQGAGLGLSICKMIIDRFGGTINVTSQLGKGSRFTVTIPYIKAITDKEKPGIFVNSNTYKFYNMNAETNDALMQDRVTLLIAEDEESNYLLLKTILQKHCNLIRARTGKEALEKYNEHPVDLIMLDIKMPEMTGIEALKEIRKMSATIPVIMQSAYVFDSDMETARQAGASDFITKPINLKLLKETLSKYCPSIQW